jgi:hypothetical protein
MSQFIKRILKAKPDAKVAIIGADVYQNIVWGSETTIPESTLLAQDAAITADELAKEAAKTDIIQAKEDAKADAFVKQFIAMTPAEVNTYVNGNVTDLASARVLLRRMALMILFLAKQAYK